MPLAWPLEGASGARGGRQRPCWSRCHRLTPFLCKALSILSVPWKVMLVADVDLCLQTGGLRRVPGVDCVPETATSLNPTVSPGGPRALEMWPASQFIT